ncbi:MAG: hypothetical protein ACP5D7_06900 [Limnospira sp.]
MKRAKALIGYPVKLAVVRSHFRRPNRPVLMFLQTPTSGNQMFRKPIAVGEREV